MCVCVRLGLHHRSFLQEVTRPLVPGFVGPACGLRRRGDRLCEAGARVIPLHHPPGLGNDARSRIKLHIQPSARKSHLHPDVVWSERGSRGIGRWCVMWIKRGLKSVLVAPHKNSHTAVCSGASASSPHIGVSLKRSLPTHFGLKYFIFFLLFFLHTRTSRYVEFHVITSIINVNPINNQYQ